MKNEIDEREKSAGNINLMREKIILSIEKSARSISKRITTVSSGFNILIPCSMFFVHSTAKASILLGSSITSLELGAISMALNIYSLVNNFRDRKLFKTAELEEKRKQELIKENRNKLKVICCDIFCAT
ncbi:MAG: hypothetical protein KTV77_00840 [Wolbachia endosymbiont of Fragariocoptes setiger]|nr:hypothetical protein [Wolbachia endosymbiont of Fragariocoptes setiger]